MAQAMILCPRCRNDLHPTSIKKGCVYRCQRCRGMFALPEDLKEILGPSANPHSWHKEQVSFLGTSHLQSPKTRSLMKHLHLSWMDKSVELDICPQTGGIWFDAGELQKLSKIIHSLDNEEDYVFYDLNTKIELKSYLFQLFTTLPVEIRNPVRKTPFITSITIAICMMMFVGQILYPSIEDVCALRSNMMETKDIWTLFTHIVVHPELYQLAVHMFLIYIFGDNLEDSFGKIRYVIFLLTCTITGSMFQVLLHNEEFLYLGTSGMISGILTGYIVMFPKVKVRMIFFFVPFYFSVQYYAFFWIALNVLFLFMGNIEFAAYYHLGSCIAGLWLSYPHRKAK